MGLNTQDMEATPSWWTFPFKPVRVDPGVFDRLDCSLYTAELKFDGWRAVLIAGPSEAELWTREKRRIEIPDSLRSDLDKLRLPTGTVLDGEIWNPEKRGGWKHSKGSECRLTLYPCCSPVASPTIGLSKRFHWFWFCAHLKTRVSPFSVLAYGAPTATARPFADRLTLHPLLPFATTPAIGVPIGVHWLPDNW